MGLCFRETNSQMTEPLGVHVCKHPQKKCSDHICCPCTLILLCSVSPHLSFTPSIWGRTAGFASEKHRHYKPQGGTRTVLLVTCISPSTLTDSPTALLHTKAAFYCLPALPLCYSWHCRPASPGLQRSFRTLVAILYSRTMAENLEDAWPESNFVRKTNAFCSCLTHASGLLSHCLLN